MRSSCIADVVIHELTAHNDSRGRVMEFYRKSWNTGTPNVQWNCVQSHARVLRGVHVHGEHYDFLFVAAGTMVLGLHDIRWNSESRGRSETIILNAEQPVGIAIPPGVCHGFYFSVPSLLVYGVSVYWNTKDEMGCRFDCPELGLDWPDREPLLSERDTNAGDYALMCQQFALSSALPGTIEIR